MNMFDQLCWFILALKEDPWNPVLISTGKSGTTMATFFLIAYFWLRKTISPNHDIFSEFLKLLACLTGIFTVAKFTTWVQWGVMVNIINLMQVVSPFRLIVRISK